LRSAVQDVPRSRFVARGRIERRGMKSATDKAPAPSHNAGGVEVDRDELERSVRAMLEALGEDVHREGLADTPKRVAKAMAFAVRGYGMSAIDAVGNALFHEPGMESDEANAAIEAERAATGAERSGGAADDHLLARHGVVLIRDVPFFSTAEDSLLPFYGRAHVGYVPSKGQIVGLSKVARLAEVFARRLQTPNRLAADIATALHEGAAPKGVHVVLEAAQLGPFGPIPVSGEAATGCFAGGNDADGYGAEFRAMLGAGVGAGPGPGVGLGEFGNGSGGRWTTHGADAVCRRCACGSVSPTNRIDDDRGCVAVADAEAASTSTALHHAGDVASECPGGDPTRRDSPTDSSHDFAGGVSEVSVSLDARPATPFEAAIGVPSPPPAPAGVAEAVEGMMRALGLGAKMDAERLSLTARRYADLMAASREGHAAAEAEPATTLGGKKRKMVDGSDRSGETELVRDLELATLCEHHLLPFHGAVHVATTGSRKDVSRAMLQKIVTMHGRRFQVQERLTRDIARDVAAATGASGVMVACRAAHLCMIARGVEKPGSTTCTSACLGEFASDPTRRSRFWRALEGGK
jgi:GTP cyclohydrolase I